MWGKWILCFVGQILQPQTVELMAFNHFTKFIYRDLMVLFAVLCLFSEFIHHLFLAKEIECLLIKQRAKLYHVLFVIQEQFIFIFRN